MKFPHRRKFLYLAAGAAAFPAVSRIASAETYPSRPVRIIVGFPAPEATGRPVRLTTSSSPKDGDLMDVWEFGGYWSAPVTDAEWKAMVDAVA